jgi:hypothetical protein
MESARRSVNSAIRSHGVHDLHRKITSYNPKRIFGTSFSSAPVPEVLEHRTVPDLAEAGHRGQEERLWQPHVQSWGRGIGRERVWQPQAHWLLRKAW